MAEGTGSNPGGGRYGNLFDGVSGAHHYMAQSAGQRAELKLEETRKLKSNSGWKSMDLTAEDVQEARSRRLGEDGSKS